MGSPKIGMRMDRKNQRLLKEGEFHGMMILWHENGVKKPEGIFENGGMVGLFTAWHENGQKMDETNLKDGKQYGLKTTWHKMDRRNLRGTEGWQYRRACD